LIRALAKTWWLLALCGVLDAMHAAMNLLMLNPDASLSLRKFALLDAVWDMGMLALAAGAQWEKDPPFDRRWLTPNGIAG